METFPSYFPFFYILFKSPPLSLSFAAFLTNIRFPFIPRTKWTIIGLVIYMATFLCSNILFSNTWFLQLDVRKLSLCFSFYDGFTSTLIVHQVLH